MSFRVKFGPKEEPAEYGPEDIYEFLDSGVLKLSFTKPGQWDEYYAPHAWTQVIAEENHPPKRKQSKGEGRGRGVTVLP